MDGSCHSAAFSQKERWVIALRVRPSLRTHRGCWRAWAARQALDVTLSSARTAREALASLDLSYRQICRYFAESFGQSPKQYQIRARLDRAKRLLRETHLSVTDVAMELNYCSGQHFATQFLAETGQTPTAYQKAAHKRGG